MFTGNEIFENSPSQDEISNGSAPRQGCRASIRHPPKVESLNLEDGTTILAHGVDSLNLSIDVEWESTKFFDYLNRIQGEAKDCEKEVSVELPNLSKDDGWSGFLKPFGMRGYQWILVGKEYTFKIGNWLYPKVRPSMLAEIRSETLWRLGPRMAADRIINFIEAADGKVITVKPGRVDLCVDIQFPVHLWCTNLIKFKATYAQKSAIHLSHHGVEGFSIGKGKIQARLYDKALEIKDRGQKEWMYDIWGFDEEPEDFKIIRVEFQILREILHELGIDSYDALWGALPNLWSYCSQTWLKFQTNPRQHHTKRKTLPWWRLLQSVFQGEQAADPLIRCKALSTESKRHFAQTYGCFTSFVAAATDQYESGLTPSFTEAVHIFMKTTGKLNKRDQIFRSALKDKLDKNYRCRMKINETIDARHQNGMPNNLPVQR